MWYNKQTRRIHKGNEGDNCICCDDDKKFYMICEDPKNPGRPLSCDSKRGKGVEEIPCPTYGSGDNPWGWDWVGNPYLPMNNFIAPIPSDDMLGGGINTSIPDDLTEWHFCESMLFGCTDSRYIRQYKHEENYFQPGDRFDGSWLAVLGCDNGTDDLDMCSIGAVETFPLPIYVSANNTAYINLTLTGADNFSDSVNGLVSGSPLVYAVRTIDGDDYQWVNNELQFAIDEYILNITAWQSGEQIHYGDGIQPTYEPQGTILSSLSLYDTEDIYKRPDDFSGGNTMTDLDDFKRMVDSFNRGNPVDYQQGILSDVNYDYDFNKDDVIIAAQNWLMPGGYCETYYAPAQSPTDCVERICDILRQSSSLWDYMDVDTSPSELNYVARECELPIPLYPPLPPVTDSPPMDNPIELISGRPPIVSDNITRRMITYTKQQLENMSIEELKRIDQGLDRQTPITPGDSVRDIDPG